jgi:hypothetical protein
VERRKRKGDRFYIYSCKKTLTASLDRSFTASFEHHPDNEHAGADGVSLSSGAEVGVL